MQATLLERNVAVVTADGSMETFICHPPAEASYPVVIFLMNAAGKREALHEMARRIARWGYYVMLPNLYYRDAAKFEADFSDSQSLAELDRLMANFTPAAVVADAEQLLAYAGADSPAAESNVGCVGYCMTGGSAFRVAAERSDVVKAAASICGVDLVVEGETSPHKLLERIQGEIYVAAAELDDWVPLSTVDRFEEALNRSGCRGSVERYPGVHHGFTFIDRPQYDETATEQHWKRLEDLFDRNLRVLDAIPERPVT
jgi:carboxymethylenebutenolidase